MVKAMKAIPRYRPFGGPALFTAGFRPFFLGGALWAALAVPLWLFLYHGSLIAPTALPPAIWHAHEMIYGYGAAVVAGFLLTAVPNWTGRMPLQGWPLIAITIVWLAGRIVVLWSDIFGTSVTACVDAAFLLLFTASIAREVIVGRNWRNLGIVAALTVLSGGNLLIHAEVLQLADTADIGIRIGIAMLLSLIALIGGRIIPSFTTNWLRKKTPHASLPAPPGLLDKVALGITVLAILAWVCFPGRGATSVALLVAGIAVMVRLCRWRGLATLSEPLLIVLHIGYGWLSFGLILLGVNGLYEIMIPSAALHALTVGAVGTMTLAVMTRATLGHTGQELTAGPGTTVIYVLVSISAVLRTASPLLDNFSNIALVSAGATWSAAFLLFAMLYGKHLARSRS